MSTDIIPFVILIFMMTIFVVISTYFVFSMKQCDKCDNNIMQHTIQSTNNHDFLKEFDERKLYDPLEEPTKRIDRDKIGNLELRQMAFNYPVRGYPDNYKWMGLLVNDTSDDSNKIIKLFGRQKYPNSDNYEYYVMINMGFDQTKVSLDNLHNKELYDGDSVVLDVLNRTYTVKLNKNDELKYNPYV